MIIYNHYTSYILTKYLHSHDISAAPLGRRTGQDAGALALQLLVILGGGFAGKMYGQQVENKGDLADHMEMFN